MKADAALDLLASLRLETGRSWGEAATETQRADASSILDADAHERFHFVTRARGYSKTTDLAAVAVAVLLRQAPAGSRSYAVAADQGQARLLLDSIEGFVRRTPGLGQLLEVQAWRVSVRRGGATLDALPADQAGAWGLRPYFAVCDELCQWATTPGPRRIFEAVTSAIPKTGGRLAIITTAGDPAHWSAKVLQHAERDELWRVSETAGPPPWMAVAFLEEQRRRLLPSSFARLFENEWVSSEDRLTTADDLAACVTLEGPLAPEPGRRYIVALDIGLKRDRTVAVVAHAEPITTVPEGQVEALTVGARVVLDRIETWSGSRTSPVRLQDVEEWLVQASTSYGRARLVVDPWQAAGSVQRLRSRGLAIEEFNFTASSVGRLASTLYLLLRNRALALPPDEELLDELANVRLRETSPGVVRLDHDSDRHDDRAVTLALAATKLLERPMSSPGPPEAGGPGPGSRWRLGGDGGPRDGRTGLETGMSF